MDRTERLEAELAGPKRGPGRGVMSAPAGADPGRIQARLGALLDGDTLFHDSPAMQRLSIALYRLLAHGSTVPRDALGAATGLTGPELDDRGHDSPGPGADSRRPLNLEVLQVLS